MVDVTIRRMWPGGPLRQWSGTRPATGKWISFAAGGYAGSYVCDECQRSVDGVYRVVGAQKWLCGACRKAVRLCKC